VGLRRPVVVVEVLGLGVDIVVSATDIDGPSKPAPLPYRQAAANLGTDPEHCLAIEDSLHGIRAAVDAGAHCIVIKGLWKGNNPVLVTYWIKPIVDTVGTSPFLVQLLDYSSGDVQLLIIRLNVVDSPCSR
jgi:phosphoglycolate phosphatase-like HAD superfamily hydrolase